jgi:hypothetical protein
MHAWGPRREIERQLRYALNNIVYSALIEWHT